jgi:hypothetical protein
MQQTISPTETSWGSADRAIEPPQGAFLKRISKAIADSRKSSPLHCLTTLHPCFINGIRTLVFRRGLKGDEPSLFQRLRKFASANGFELLEERRTRELACRDERRRLAPILMFAAGLAANTAMADNGTLIDDGKAVVPTIEIIGERSQADERAYMNVAGKRFISQPHGEVEMIMNVATEVRAKGVHHRVRTRGMQMPSEYTDTFIDRYDYRMSEQCGGQVFSYYEGDGFAALGHHTEKDKIILDVLAGGGPFSAPRLWGTYDQVLNSNVRMKLMFGDGLKDGMGVLMASYKIGLMPVMRTASKNYYGELYSRAVHDAAACQQPALPQARQAGTVSPAAADEAS